MTRVFTALVALPVLIFATWWSNPYPFVAIAALAILAALHEFYVIADRAGAPPFRIAGLASGVVSIAVAAGVGPEWNSYVLAATTVVVMIATLGRVDDKSRILASVGSTMAGVLYVATLGSYLVAVRMLTAPPQIASKLITLFLVIVMMSDTAAYYTGKTFGKRKLAPRVSPAKTVEGSIGGLVGSTVAAVAAKYVFFPELPIVHAIALGAGMGVMGQVGDLVESLLKRGSDVKDAASILPGHGGFLDRLDSMLLNAPILYAYGVLVLGARP